MNRRQYLGGLWAIALALTLIIQSCQIGAAGKSKLLLTGSSTVAPLVAEIAERYQIQQPTAQIAIQTGGSNRGIADVIAGSADVGMASRALKADEQHLHVFTLAQDGIAMLVHRDNPVGELSPDQIRQIYLNQINSWADVGGQSRPLTVISKTEQHATFDLFVDYFGVNPADILADIVVGDNEEMIQAVMDHPNAIGYVSIGTAEYKIVHGIPLKLLPLQGTKATIANVRNGQFPLSRPLNLVTRTLPTGLAESFINFAQSDAVNDLIEQQAFVPTTGDY